MNHWCKKWPAIAMAIISLGASCIAYSQFHSHKAFLVLGSFFGAFSLFFAWTAFQRRIPELRIEQDSIWIRGSRFCRSNIASSKVQKMYFPGGYGTYLILKFVRMPDLNLSWKIYKQFERLNLSMSTAPKFDASGEPLPEEPRLIIGLNWLTDDIESVNQKLKIEQADAGNRA